MRLAHLPVLPVVEALDENLNRRLDIVKLKSIKLGGRRYVRRGEVRALITPSRRVPADQLQPSLFEDL